MTKNEQKLSLLQRSALYLFDRPRRTALVALAVAVFGVISFTMLMRREGFPAMNVPYATGQAVYMVNDAAKVDREVAGPITKRIAKEVDIKSVSSSSQSNVAIIIMQFDDLSDAEKRTTEISQMLQREGLIAEGVKLQLTAASMGFTQRGDDAVLSLYSEKNASSDVGALAEAGKSAVKFIETKRLSQVQSVALIDPIESALNPASGQLVVSQTSFERFVVRDGQAVKNYHAVAIGVKKTDTADTIKFDHELRDVTNAYAVEQGTDGYRLAVSASEARNVNQQMHELGRTLLEGLLAVLVVGSLVIAFRASLITVLSMITVILSSIAFLYAIGYTLNTIVLFSLILGLALIVDDTIIMVEAIDKERHRLKDKNAVISSATGKVARAMIAATTTAALSFTPLFFVGGVIGQFVRAVPVTIVSALFISLIVALVVIPLLARYIMLKPKKPGASVRRERAAEAEAAIARFISKPILWARGKRKREFTVALLALLVTVGFVGGGALLFTQVKFNIFPPSKDSNELAVTFIFPKETDIAKAEELTDSAVDRMTSVLGDTMENAANYGSTSNKNARFAVYLTDYSSRSVTSHDLVKDLKAAFSNTPDGVVVDARPVDIGPPASNFAVRINAEDNREAAATLANDIADYLKTADIRRLDNTKIVFDKVAITGEGAFVRDRGEAYVGVTASFGDDDTTTQINRTKAVVAAAFTADKLKSYGLESSDLSYDFGMEQDNQESFKTLLLAFPVVVIVIFLVLAIEFRSLLQPLIIFMAVPFSLFGVMLGLYLTNNAFSFFAMLGFFALIGLSIKNTILLTDYANQARRAGKGPVDAIHDALAERFRPLLATSLTAVISLVPLALASPFWQALCVVLVGGLLSSTLLVLTVFPYFYLGAEYLRIRLDTWRRSRA